MTETLSDLIKICNHNLKNSKDCVDYLNSRGFSHYEIEFLHEVYLVVNFLH